MKIRIIETPPGPAPQYIREAWVGVELRVVEDAGSGGFWHGAANEGGHIVSRQEAVVALRAAGKEQAAEFWSAGHFGEHFRFKKDVCKVIK